MVNSRNGAHKVDLEHPVVPESKAVLNKKKQNRSSLLHHPMCGWVLSSPCLLARLSGSSDSWPRNKSRSVPFLNGFEWKLAIKSGTTPREDIGEEPSWVYKKQAGSIRSLTCVAHMLRPLFYAAKSQWEHHYCNAWLLMLFPHYQFETQ